jgi:hypothetical protein
VLVVEGLLLFAVDSGKTKIFGHSDMQYGSSIGVLEQVLKLDPHAITRSPTHLPCTIQPNGYDCGYHVVINACSISAHIDASDGAGINLTTWEAPTSTPSEVRQFRRELYDRAAALPYASVPPPDDGSDDDDDDDESSDGFVFACCPAQIRGAGFWRISTRGPRGRHAHPFRGLLEYGEEKGI